MQSQTGQVPLSAAVAMDVPARDYLLAEVDFKWLMAGLGQWIDAPRFHSDPAYASALIRWALASPSFPLRECAAVLQAGLAGPAPPDVA